jgi:hypothetical protein
MSSKQEKQSEPIVIDTDPTATIPGGHYRDGGVTQEERIKAAASEREGIWIEREDQAKQGMARKGDPNPQAAPGHPHIGPTKGSGLI